MQIKYVKNKNIDKKIWDKTVFAAYNGLIYGCSWFLDNLADDWDAVIVGDYEYILPLPFKKNFSSEV